MDRRPCVGQGNGVRLPDLDQRIRHRPRVLVQHSAGDDDALPERLAGVRAGEVAVERSDRSVAVDGTGRSDSVRGITTSGRRGGATRWTGTPARRVPPSGGDRGELDAARRTAIVSETDRQEAGRGGRDVRLVIEQAALLER